MTKVAIVAAMEREVRPLIQNWKARTIEYSGRRYRLFENGDTVLICGGIGSEAARRATQAVIQGANPSRVISVGFAGALNASLQVGHVFKPRTVINAADGVRTEISGGDGILVSSTTVANKEQKIKLSQAYNASAVDMEAAAVAQGAHARGIEFAALKVISDAADFDLPPMERFVANDGTFRSGHFACHVALRPWLWGATIALARNSSRASQALRGALVDYLGRETSHDESLANGLNPTGLNQTGLNRTELEQLKAGSEFASAHTSVGTQSHTRAERK